MVWSASYCLRVVSYVLQWLFWMVVRFPVGITGWLLHWAFVCLGCPPEPDPDSTLWLACDAVGPLLTWLLITASVNLGLHGQFGAGGLLWIVEMAGLGFSTFWCALVCGLLLYIRLHASSSREQAVTEYDHWLMTHLLRGGGGYPPKRPRGSMIYMLCCLPAAFAGALIAAFWSEPAFSIERCFANTGPQAGDVMVFCNAAVCCSVSSSLGGLYRTVASFIGLLFGHIYVGVGIAQKVAAFVNGQDREEHALWTRWRDAGGQGDWE